MLHSTPWCLNKIVERLEINAWNVIWCWICCFFHPSHFARFFVWIGNSIENCNHNKLRIARHGLSRQKKSTIFVSLKSEHTHKCFIFYILNSPFTTVPRLWLNFTQFVEIIMHKNPKKNENQIFRTFNDLAKWLRILSRSSGVTTLLNI